MDIEQILNYVYSSASQATAKIEREMAAANLQNPGELLKMQFSVQQYSNFISFGSSLIKVIKDMLSGIIAKI